MSSKNKILTLVAVAVVLLAALGAFIGWCWSVHVTEETQKAEKDSIAKEFESLAPEKRPAFLKNLVQEKVLHVYLVTNAPLPYFSFVHERRIPADTLAEYLDQSICALRDNPTDKAKAGTVELLALANELAPDCEESVWADRLLVRNVEDCFSKREFARSTTFLANMRKPKTPETNRIVRSLLTRELRQHDPSDIINFLETFADCPYFDPADFIGQLTEDAIIKFAGNGTEGSENVKGLRQMLAFSDKIMPLLSENAKRSLLDRRLDAFFLSKDYDGAIALLDKGLPSHSPGWCKGTAAKLRAHKAMDAGQNAEAVKQLLVFGEFMLSDEQKDFEECDPTTGILYSRDWVVARNFKRCADMTRATGDAKKADEYLAEAKKFFTTALEKAKDDKKSLDELQKETKPLGL